MPRNEPDERLKKYPSTDKFRVTDTIGVPHPYCLTPKHIAVASDQFNGRLGKEAILAAEEQGARCDICKKKARNYSDILTFEQHETALLVEVADDRQLKDIPELHPYLLSIKDMCEKDGFAGFAFKQARTKSPCETGREHTSANCPEADKLLNEVDKP